MPKAYKQGEMVERLESEVRREMRALEKTSVEGLAKLWRKYSNDIKASLFVQYRTAAPSGRWELEHAKATGAIYRMEKSVMRHMEEFRQAAREYIRKELHSHYTHEYHTAAYILDQVTPPFCPVKIKPEVSVREADVYSGPGATTKWYQRFDGWCNAWESALKNNIMLNAINSGLAEDVIAEVDATRIGTPAVTFWDSMGRLFLTEMLKTQAEARDNMTSMNGDLIADEVWQTMEDERMCDECGPLNGKTRDEIQDDPPLHPRCRCFWRVMPKDWIDLSKRDWQTAHALDLAGVVPDGMYIRDEATGDIKAHVVVKFSDWAKDKLTLSGK